MKFKTKRIENEWKDDKLAKTLKEIVDEAAKYAKKKWKWDFFLTSIFRTPEEDVALHASGIHTSWRAVDVRTKDQKKEAVDDVSDFINKKWTYDPKRPNMKVCFKEPHGNNIHAHFQVHPNTVAQKDQNGSAAAVAPEVAADPASFRGEALPLSPSGFAEITDRLGVKAAELWAVIDVETYGYGFIADRRPLILYERHIFSRLTKREFDKADPDISNKKPGGYGKGGAHQFDRLNKALGLNRTEALKSASWGIGQVMGMNFKIAGFGDVEEMVSQMVAAEDNQLNAMANFIIVNKIDKAMRQHDWATFARVYNGKNYAINKYDTRLAAAYNKRRVLLPDMAIRAAQVYLTYLGYDPGRIDGLGGTNTYRALNNFQTDNNLPVKNEVTDTLLAKLKKKTAELS